MQSTHCIKQERSRIPKNIAVIFAGGFGKRMIGHTIPKQFLEVNGKTVLTYTLEHFQKHEEIDGIILVTLVNWIDYCRDMIGTWGLHKVSAIVSGGATSQESIRNGLQVAQKLYSKDDIVLIHDGVRPLIDAKIITDCIQCVRQHGTAITVSPQMETIMVQGEESERYEIVERDRCRVAKAPQCFYLGDIVDAQQTALSDSKLGFIDCASLMEHYGHSLYAVQGPEDNIKITTELDFHVFQAIMKERGSLHDNR